MKDTIPWQLPPSGDAGEPRPAKEAVLEIWPTVAATAWGGYQEHGRGAVIVDQGGMLFFLPGPISPHYEQLIARYNPELEAVVSIDLGGESATIEVVAGWPAPPDAWKITPGERLRLTEH